MATDEKRACQSVYDTRNLANNRAPVGLWHARAHLRVLRQLQRRPPACARI